MQYDSLLHLAKKVLQSSQTDDLTLAKIKTKSATEEVSKCKMWVAVLGMGRHPCRLWAKRVAADGLMEAHTENSLNMLFCGAFLADSYSAFPSLHCGLLQFSSKYLIRTQRAGSKVFWGGFRYTQRTLYKWISACCTGSPSTFTLVLEWTAASKSVFSPTVFQDLPLASAVQWDFINEFKLKKKN